MLRKGRGFVEKNWITRPEDAKGSWEESTILGSLSRMERAYSTGCDRRRSYRGEKTRREYRLRVLGVSVREKLHTLAGAKEKSETRNEDSAA